MNANRLADDVRRYPGLPGMAERNARESRQTEGVTGKPRLARDLARRVRELRNSFSKEKRTTADYWKALKGYRRIESQLKINDVVWRTRELVVDVLASSSLSSGPASFCQFPSRLPDIRARRRGRCGQMAIDQIIQ